MRKQKLSNRQLIERAWESMDNSRSNLANLEARMQDLAKRQKDFESTRGRRLPDPKWTMEDQARFIADISRSLRSRKYDEAT